MSLPMEKAYYTARATPTPIMFGDARNGNIQIAVEFAIEDHEQFSGEVLPWVGHFTDKAAARTIESLMHAGWTGEDVAALKGVPGSEVLPDPVQLVVEPEQITEGDRAGEWVLKVQWVNKPGAGRFKFKEETSDDKLRAFSAQMRATVRAVRGAGGAPRKPAAPSGGGGSGSYGGSGRAQQPHPNAPGGANDDIPFASASLADDPMLALRPNWV